MDRAAVLHRALVSILSHLERWLLGRNAGGVCADGAPVSILSHLERWLLVAARDRRPEHARVSILSHLERWLLEVAEWAREVRESFQSSATSKGGC